ncbi:hypothetical protein ACWD5Q_00955 [Streptomyces sp. NPDC002513]
MPTTACTVVEWVVRAAFAAGRPVRLAISHRRRQFVRTHVVRA